MVLFYSQTHAKWVQVVAKASEVPPDGMIEVTVADMLNELDAVASGRLGPDTVTKAVKALS